MKVSRLLVLSALWLVGLGANATIVNGVRQAPDITTIPFQVGASAEDASKVLASIDSKVSDTAKDAVKQWASGQDMTSLTRNGLGDLQGQNLTDILVVSQFGFQIILMKINRLIFSKKYFLISSEFEQSLFLYIFW